MNWISVSIPVALMGSVCLYVGVYHLLMFYKRPHERVQLAFSATCFIVGCYDFFCAGLYNSTSIPQGMFWQRYQFAALAMLSISLSWFVYYYTESRQKRTFLTLTALFALLFILGLVLDGELTLSLAAPKPKLVSLGSLLNVTYYEVDPGLIYQIQFALTFLGSLYLMFLLVRHYLADKNRSGRPIIISFSVFFISAAVDMLIASGMLLFVYTAEYVYLVIILSMAYVLLGRFVKLHEEVEDLNRNLELKVEQRTDELKAAMEELEAINERLTDTNRELDCAHQVAKRDMTMAANIQLALMQKDPPVTAQWDIAFVFKPISGVSGDLYDIYERDGRLHGILLLDVSGHGIASGLITMIARTIFHRYFYRMQEYALNTAVEAANRSLIAEIKDVDNYLTGVFLRFGDDAVEYVNAGHPDIFLRRGATGAAQRVCAEDDRHKGAFLGSTELAAGYRTVGFTMNEGDALILYTDCLNECRCGEDGDPYGEERILRSFGESDGSAREILDSVMADFTAHTRGKPLEDDLTVIVVKRKVNA